MKRFAVTTIASLTLILVPSSVALASKAHRSCAKHGHHTTCPAKSKTQAHKPAPSKGESTPAAPPWQICYNPGDREQEEQCESALAVEEGRAPRPSPAEVEHQRKEVGSGTVGTNGVE